MKWFNECNQEIGFPLKDWQPKKYPERVTIEGIHCWIEPLNSQTHAAQLFEAHKKAKDERIWTYIPIGPFNNLEEYQKFITDIANSSQEVQFAIINKKTGRAVGSFALMRIDKENGVAEVGYVVFSPELQKTTMATEAHYLLMKYVFESLDYRRLEWKCDSLNKPSQAAAQRLGYKFEGTFRQVQVYKGRNRDTHWFSVIDCEWDHCEKAFEQWMDEENFANGKQKRSLVQVRENLGR